MATLHVAENQTSVAHTGQCNAGDFRIRKHQSAPCPPGSSRWQPTLGQEHPATSGDSSAAQSAGDRSIPNPTPAICTFARDTGLLKFVADMGRNPCPLNSRWTFVASTTGELDHCFGEIVLLTECMPNFAAARSGSAALDRFAHSSTHTLADPMGGRPSLSLSLSLYNMLNVISQPAMLDVSASSMSPNAPSQSAMCDVSAASRSPFGKAIGVSYGKPAIPTSRMPTETEFSLGKLPFTPSGFDSQPTTEVRQNLYRTSVQPSWLGRLPNPFRTLCPPSAEPRGLDRALPNPICRTPSAEPSVEPSAEPSAEPSRKM